MAAHVRGVPGHHDHVAGADGDCLLAAGADVGLARLGGVDPPDIEAEGFPSGGQVGDLLQLLQLEGCTFGLLALSTASRPRARHATQVSHSRSRPIGTVTGNC
jgi:hypothetical protein